MRKRIALYGSTGSIGIQALEVVRAYLKELKVEILTAGNNYELLIQQAKEFVPHVVVIANTAYYQKVSSALASLPIKVFAGEKALAEVAEMDIYDIMLAAIVGFNGLASTLSAASQGKAIALANKESLVVAGELIMKEAKENNAVILPVDSEHSAIFQCMHSGMQKEVAKVILTASGGALRDFSKEQLNEVTAREALRHPTWTMGNKVTIDSASLMNKGLEMMEAKWLFDLRAEQIDAVVHPQSIIHSMVEFVDGNMLSQMSKPDMRLPIAYALLYPHRLASSWGSNYNPLQKNELSFYPIDSERFPNIELAKHAMHRGGSMPCILNAANEVAVAAFLQDKISFYGMSELIEKCMSTISTVSPLTLADYLECDKETRSFAERSLNL